MTEAVIFNPFVDRTSRDIRNALSSSLLACIDQASIEPAQQAADSFLREHPDEVYGNYIRDRLQRYLQAVHTITSTSDDIFIRSLVLWDLELFFEMHEVLEHAWYHAEGDRKRIMQALIRAAGVYIKLEYGYAPQARRIADKSLEVLEQQQVFLSQYFQPQLLLDALRALKPPPKLGIAKQ